MALANDPCTATMPHATKSHLTWQCRKRADHVLKPGKYARQHLDMKTPPGFYWDPTDEEITNYQARISQDANA